VASLLGIQWLPAGAGRIHANAVQAGCDKDGGPLYVGRAYFRRNLLPAKIAPNHQTGYVSFEGAEHRVVDYEVKTCTAFHWNTTLFPNGKVTASYVGQEGILTGLFLSVRLSTGKCQD
jgi:hypothetical protein